MAWQQSDLDALDRSILNGTKKVTFADGRSTEYHSLDEMRRLRNDMKGELAASRSSAYPRSTVGRIIRR